VVGDSPTNVYATFNPLDRNGQAVAPALSNGNLTAPSLSAGNTNAVSSQPIPSTGKWYMEFEYSTAANPNYGLINNTGTGHGNQTGNFSVYHNEVAGYALCNTNAPGSDGNHATTSGDVGLIAVDASANKLWCGRYRSGVVVWCGGGDPATGTSPTFSGAGGGGVYSTAFDITQFNRPYASSGGGSDVVNANFGQRTWRWTPPAGFMGLCTANMPATSGRTSGSFTGNASADGPFVYTGAVPQTLTINGNAVTWGAHADKLANGFKIRSSSASYNASGANTWAATYNKKPTVGSNKVPANAQANP